MRGAALSHLQVLVANRESCIEAVEKVLQFVEDIAFVSREFIDIEDISTAQFPCVLIEDTGVETIDYKTGDWADVEFSLTIAGYVNNISSSKPINDFDVKVKTALGLDFLSSTGIMKTANIVGFSIEPLTEKSGIDEYPRGGFVRSISIMYEGRLSTGL